MSSISAAATASPAGAQGLKLCSVEAERIGLLLKRDGPDVTRAWVKRTLVIYRRAVLNPAHFASSPDYRRLYLLSCADFRRWLGQSK